MSVYGEVAFADENFKMKHENPGILSMVFNIKNYGQ